MKQVGSLSDWLGFIDSQVPAILRVVFETWDAFPAPYCDEREDVITKAFVKVLKRSRDRCELPFRIDIQFVEVDPAAGEEQGRLDIVFSPPAPREDIYFCLECKRINVRSRNGVRAYFAEYITHGMSRFIRGQYGKHAKHGGILAYVLNGDITSAIAGVEANINRYSRDLGIEDATTLEKCSLFPEDDRIRETHHQRNPGLSTIAIYHLFMPGDSGASFRPV
jgi:hypothetical protein